VTELRNTTGSFSAVSVAPAAINEAAQQLRQAADETAAQAATLQNIAGQLGGDVAAAIDKAVRKLQKAADETATEAATLETLAGQLANPTKP
jgi:hypothetical protein